MKILFVCLGNICRSPTAEGVFRKLASESPLAGSVEVDSAGTVGFHAGDPPDRRSIEHAALRGVDLRGLRAREVIAADFNDFDHVIAMDERNVAHLKSICPARHIGKIKLLLAFADTCKLREVPDPYHGEAGDFELVLDVIEEGSRGLVNYLVDQQRAAITEHAESAQLVEGQKG